jgi:hypothetical protein
MRGKTVAVDLPGSAAGKSKRLSMKIACLSSARKFYSVFSFKACSGDIFHYRSFHIDRLFDLP